MDRPDSPARGRGLGSSTRRPAASRWVARLSAATAVTLFALVVLAIHLEHRVHRSTDDVVSTFRVNNGYFDHRVDFTRAGAIGDDARGLRDTVAQIATMAAEDTRVLEQILPDTARLLAATRHDLRTAEDLTGIAEDLQTSATGIRQTAGQADDTVRQADRRVAEIAALVDQLNRYLADIDHKLPLPTLGPGAAHPKDSPR